jgi:hypothetical protein
VYEWRGTVVFVDDPISAVLNLMVLLTLDCVRRDASSYFAES